MTKPKSKKPYSGRYKHFLQRLKRWHAEGLKVYDMRKIMRDWVDEGRLPEEHVPSPDVVAYMLRTMGLEPHRPDPDIKTRGIRIYKRVEAGEPRDVIAASEKLSPARVRQIHKAVALTRSTKRARRPGKVSA